MNQALLQQWMDLVQPTHFGELREDMKQGFAHLAIDDESRQKVQQAIDLLDEAKIRSIWTTIAGEHFSEDSLIAAIAFFSSDLGKKYVAERNKVTKAAVDATHSHIFECVNKVFKIVP
jgi:hypothetical protein